MTRTDRRTLVRQLAAEGLSQRAIAKRLGIGKDTVRRDLAPAVREGAPESAPQDAPDDPAAPQASGHDGPESAPQDAPPAAPVDTGETDAGAPPRRPAGLPRRVAQPLDGIDLSQWPAARRDLAVLAQSGSPAEALVHQAIVATAYAYRQALDRGDLQPGQAFLVRRVDLVPAARPDLHHLPPAPATAGA
ncbi:hypothetical protein [Streptomyces antibioticus]|uniref:hypothetical protein n=1 Tax=Streptomyces antibioticus TaxID=1890 RepID=UPI003D74DB52